MNNWLTNTVGNNNMPDTYDACENAKKEGKKIFLNS